MADDKGFWIAVVEYKWIFAAIAVMIALNEGWIAIPVLDGVLGWAERLLKAAVPG